MGGGGGASGPREWIYSQLGKGRVVRNARYKLYSTGQLFDLSTDPLEEHDLSRSDAPEARSARESPFLAKAFNAVNIQGHRCTCQSWYEAEDGIGSVANQDRAPVRDFKGPRAGRGSSGKLSTN